MSDNKIIDLSYELRNEIRNSSYYKELKKKESWVDNDKDTRSMILEYEELNELYNKLKLAKSKEASKVLVKIVNLKEKIDNDELIKIYKKTYHEFKEFIYRVENILFDKIKETNEGNENI